ncbi:alpha/beta fold hydrolase [Streptomyces sp. V3I7]|uniref:alpha/beta fold hydrolase n=1 Tax=Streptomyces sp. V3I7 TaxID=3042278 RepID=UPI0027887931|nr:alpha/beta hydrolase family protein [Streptomyces sp. V3I7]MDQ0993730.1 pimeloyl-ACP methyl ester carboxylesterase [Streptomyces sp. V3I7]
MNEQPHVPSYDITGAGPVLLLVPGGAGHPMGLEPMAARLAAWFTVVTYDPLGLAHGRLGLPVGEQRVEDWSDGARRVLEEVLPAWESAYVMGFSAGGVVVLDLLARYPERLAHVVAHEPACVTVLPDGARERESLIEQLEAQRGEPLASEGESATPMGVFFAHVLRPFTAYTPLAPADPSRLTVAAGADSRGGALYRTAEVVARRTGGRFAEFPGGHLGVMEHPVDCADLLVKTLVPVTSRGRG